MRKKVFKKAAVLFSVVRYSGCRGVINPWIRTAKATGSVSK